MGYRGNRFVYLLMAIFGGCLGDELLIFENNRVFVKIGR